MPLLMAEIEYIAPHIDDLVHDWSNSICERTRVIAVLRSAIDLSAAVSFYQVRSLNLIFF